jgi:poly-gamma-glutamate synthesis protein (capsule biosynthesis protein)
VADALTPYRTTVKGQRIAVIAATQVLDANIATEWTATETRGGLASAADTDHLVAAVQQARATSDTVVVYLHWGTELQTCPNSAQGPLAERLIAAGADVVVGSHAHRLLAGGHLGGAYVDYGLGNLAFYTDSGPTTESGVLTLTVTGRDVDHAAFTPAQLQGQVAHPLTGAAATQALRHWEGLRSCAGLAP